MRKRIEKPWGYEELVELNDSYAVKFLFMKKGKQCSLQHHEYKTETLMVLDGELEVFFNNEWKLDNICVLRRRTARNAVTR